MHRSAMKLFVATGIAAATVIGGAAPAFAHDCINVSAKTTNASAGTYDVVVYNPVGSSSLNSSDTFTYSAASSPTVTSLSVSSGLGCAASAISGKKKLL